jgi:probable HAF family extracellular repeat protein
MPSYERDGFPTTGLPPVLGRFLPWRYPRFASHDAHFARCRCHFLLFTPAFLQESVAMFRLCVIILSVLSLLLSVAGPVSAAPVKLYDVIDLGIVGCPQTIPNALNEHGDIVGQYLTSPPGYLKRAFVSHDGATSDLGMLSNSLDMTASGINAGGQIVGWAYTMDYEYRAFLKSGGTFTDLTIAAGNNPNIRLAQASAINDDGQITGYAYVNGSAHAFIYRDGVMADLGTPQGCGSSYGYAINAGGQVVGYADTPAGVQRAFLYSNGQMTLLGTAASVAHDINDSGQVVGSYSTGSGIHAFLYSGGTMNDLGSLPGASSNTAESINSRGQVVGFSHITGVHDRAFLYSDGTMRSLNEVIDPALRWDILWANAINDKGWIAACGHTPNGEQHAVLLTPVPEPSALALLAIGAIGLLSALGHARRRR